MGHCLGGCCWSGAGGCSLASEGSRPRRMREVELGWGKVLLVKDNGELHALGHKCPHYGAPLVKGEVWVPTGAPSAGGGLRGRGHGTGVPLEPGLCGGPALPPPGVLSRGRVRCPWHGACFNVSTGDLEDFPGLDSLHKFQVGPGVQWGEPRGGAGAGAPQSPGLSSTALVGEDREREGVHPGQQAGEGVGAGELRQRERPREGLWVPGVGGSLAGRPRASPVGKRHHWGRRAWPAGWAQRGWR